MHFFFKKLHIINILMICRGFMSTAQNPSIKSYKISLQAKSLHTLVDTINDELDRDSLKTTLIVEVVKK